MRCDEARRLMPLYSYGELAPAEEERFEAHVHECELCQRALGEQSRFQRLLDDAAVTPPEGMLTAARVELRSRLAAEPEVHGFRAWIRDTFWFRAGAAPVWMQAAAALVLVAGGFFGGRGFGVAEAGLAGTPVGSEVRYVQPQDSGRVQVVVYETHEKVFTGTLEDEPIRRLLVSATREVGNPALRVQSVELLKNDCRSGEIRKALLNALQHDPDPSVRIEALDGLKPFAAEPQVRDVFSHVLLGDANPGVRMQVISALLQQRQEDEMVGVFQELMRRENDAFVRQQCTRALHAMNASAEEF
jgi:hypothetical protein